MRACMWAVHEQTQTGNRKIGNLKIRLQKTSNLRGAANLCAKLLTAHGQGYGSAGQVTRNTPETMEVIKNSIRFSHNVANLWNCLYYSCGSFEFRY